MTLVLVVCRQLVLLSLTPLHSHSPLTTEHVLCQCSEALTSHGQLQHCFPPKAPHSPSPLPRRPPSPLPPPSHLSMPSARAVTW